MTEKYHNHLRALTPPQVKAILCISNSASIKNVRSIEKLEWAVSEENAASWRVIIGDNGTGKSTFVRSIALALIGPKDA